MPIWIHIIRKQKHTLLCGILLFLFYTPSLHAQIVDPVKWTTTIQEDETDTLTLVFHASITTPYHLYGLDIPSGGPTPIQFSFTPDESHYLLSELIQAQTKPIVSYDSTFSMHIAYYIDSASFTQRVVRKDAQAFQIQGRIRYMCCSEHSCIPLSHTFILKVNPTSSAQEASTTLTTPSASGTSPDKTLFSFFLIAFLAGLAGVFTPCVFPMIPMIVSFFMRDASKRNVGIRNGVCFGISIVFIYTLIGVIVSLTGMGEDFAHQLSIHWIPNTLFFLLFLFFALSFFGCFEISFSGNLTTKIDAQREKGGMWGIFFLALTLVVVSFSCTGPIVGALLIEAASHDVSWKPILGMFGFALAFALPFSILAIFPTLLKRLPKSGGWLNEIKVVLGLLLTALSLRFLLNIDQSYHLQLLTKEIYLVIWILIFVLMGLYLWGKIRLKHDRPLAKIGPLRILFIIAIFSFVIYLFTGLFGAPLTALSGYIPTLSHSSRMEKVAIGKSLNATQIDTTTLCSSTPKYAALFEWPYALRGYFDYNEGMACAQQRQLPALIIFTGRTCTVCKRMEAQIWSQPTVLPKLQNDFVLIKLYTDDRTRLSVSEIQSYGLNADDIQTIGDLNAQIQKTKFNTNATPFYAILKTNGETVATIGDANTEDFTQFLSQTR